MRRRTLLQGSLVTLALAGGATAVTAYASDDGDQAVGAARTDGGGSPLAIGIDEGVGPLVVLLHGFPELPSSWRRQVEPLVQAGYHVVAPFVRGYGASPAPIDPAQYTADLLAQDVIDVIDSYGEDQAVVIGNDQGANIVWATAQFHPERVRGAVALSVPYQPRAPRPPMELVQERAGDQFNYVLYFLPPGQAEDELDANTAEFLLRAHDSASGTPTGPFVTQPVETGRVLDYLPPAPAQLPAFLDPADYEEMVDTYNRTGFTGGLNIYRAADLNWRDVPELGTQPITVPTAFIAGQFNLGTLDPASLTATAAPNLTDLRALQIVPGAGHWVQQEAPEAVTTALLSFLDGLDA